MREFRWRCHGALRFAAVAGLVVAFAGCSKSKSSPPFQGATTWSISGTVSGDISADVTVRVLGKNKSAISGPDGRYTITGLADGTYTVEASRDGFAFTPPTHSVAVSGANVTGKDFTSVVGVGISGSVSGDSSAVVTVTLAGPSPATTTTTTTTDANGNYLFANVAAGSYLVTPSLVGGWAFVPANCFVTVTGATVTGPNFVLIPPVYAISGRIIGAVTAGVIVTLSGGADAIAVTDPAGNYSFTGLASGSYSVTPSQTGYAFTPASLEVPLSSSNATGQDFVAGATHRIAGRFSGDVLAGVTVTLSGAGGGTGTTDAYGYFEFTDLLDGSYVVTPSLEGYTFAPANRTIALAAADLTNAMFTATRVATYSVTGSVTGDVLAGVTMTLAGATEVVTTTDVTGAFALTGVPAGTYLLIPTLEDFVFDSASRLVTVSTAAVTGQNFTATVDPSARTITGAVSGDVVAGVTVTLQGPSPATSTTTVTTDAAGRFKFRALLDGLYRVTPSLAGYAFGPSNCVVTVSGPSVTNVAFTGAAVPHAISGKVSGAVTVGVTITLSGDADAVTVTGSGGSYTFAGRLNGVYTVTPSLAGYVFGPKEASVTLQGADSPGVDFVAAATHLIAGTISGDVVAGVKVTLSGAAAGEITTDGTGNFEFTDLADGVYLVTPSLEGYVFDPDSLPVALVGGDGTGANFVSTLVPTYSVSGTISGAVVSGVTVTLWGPTTDTMTTGATGAYTFTGLGNGSYMVIPSVVGHEFNPASRAFRVNGAGVIGQDFTALP